MRNRYVVGSTSRYGQTAPLTVVNGGKLSMTCGSVLCSSRPVNRPSRRLEVSVCQQQRHLVGRPLRQVEFTLAFVVEHIQAGETGVDGEAGRAHHVVVEPQQRRALVIGVAVEGLLTRRRQVLRPPVARRRSEATVQMDDRVAAQCGGGGVGFPTAAPRTALHRHAVLICEAGRSHDRDRQDSLELVVPQHLDGTPRRRR